MCKATARGVIQKSRQQRLPESTDVCQMYSVLRSIKWNSPVVASQAKDQAAVP